MTKKTKMIIAAVCLAAILIITLVAVASCKGAGKAPGGGTTAVTGAVDVPGTTDVPGTADASGTADADGTTDAPGTADVPGTAGIPDDTNGGGTTVAEPEGSSSEPETSAASPEVSGATPEVSGTTPEISGAAPDTSAATPEVSVATPETSTATPETSTATPETSTAAPETSTVAPETSTTPETTTGNAPVHYHTFGAWAVTRHATCNAAGEEARSCTRCGAKETRSIAQLTHSFGGWSVTRPATCGAAGEEARSCTRCGVKETRGIAQLTHSYGGWSVTRTATCNAAGEESRRCSICGKQETRGIAQLTHSYGAWSTTRPATCSTAGEEARSCANCGATETRSTALTGHVYTVTKQVDNDPFSDTFGSDGIETCPGCGATRAIPYSDPDFASDAYLRLLEQRVLYWINQYRAEEGVAPAQMLPRMWEYAQVRAPYLINDFSHNGHDEKAAATSIKYGQYSYGEITKYDPTTGEIIHTGQYTEGYVPNCGEAIGNAYLDFEDINAFARLFATACRNSPAHWSYVGIRKYETVGVARSGRAFYLVICTRDEIKYED